MSDLEKDGYRSTPAKVPAHIDQTNNAPHRKPDLSMNEGHASGPSKQKRGNTLTHDLSDRGHNQRRY